MPRTAVPVTSLTPNAQNLTPAGTALDPANGHTIAAPPLRTSQLLIRITNTFAGTKLITFKAGGSNPPAVRKGLGDLAITIAASTGDNLFLLESARFGQVDGTINVDIAAGAVGFITAIALPKAV